MRLLIDTHSFLWYIGERNRLTAKAQRLIESFDGDVILSIASVWEISIKKALGRLEIEGGFSRLPSILTTFRIELVPIIFDHTLKQSQLPFHHKDPFDRMIAAQAIVEGLDLVSSDSVFDTYFANTEVARIW
ncbi:MAG: type II toxin-antitoxin system VapC family toxin [Acidobacteria bacterium]|nr:type II toxin-antitoxin system VapC family toxin [Acidobacteriota bacterium]